MNTAIADLDTEIRCGANGGSYRDQLGGTSIDPSTLLSADYFNLFNEVVMLLSIFPELFEDVEAWKFKTYEQHYCESVLPFADLAVRAFQDVDPSIREEFESTVDMMRMMVEETRLSLAENLAAGRTEVAMEQAMSFALELQQMIEMGGMIVNGRNRSMSQSAIDDLF